MSTDADDDHDFDLPLDEDAVTTGAAVDSSDSDERFAPLPRLLRYAAMIDARAEYIPQRLIAEIEELCPGLPQTSAWAAGSWANGGLELAAELDRRAVACDDSMLRSLADCVRLICLPTPRTGIGAEEHRRVGKALLHAFRKVSLVIDRELCCELERFVVGWAALPLCTDLVALPLSAAGNAAGLGRIMSENQLRRTVDGILRERDITATRN